MNINNQNPSESKCCLDYCSKTFIVEEQEIINSYKCSDKKISSADIWNIQKNKRYFNS